jgi:hypothetical protein
MLLFNVARYKLIVILKYQIQQRTSQTNSNGVSAYKTINIHTAKHIHKYPLCFAKGASASSITGLLPHLNLKLIKPPQSTNATVVTSFDNQESVQNNTRTCTWQYPIWDLLLSGRLDDTRRFVRIHSIYCPECANWPDFVVLPLDSVVIL